MTDSAPGLPPAVDRATFQAVLDKLLVRWTVHPRHTARRASDRLVPPRVLSTARPPRLRNLLDEAPGRGGDGLQLRADGPHRVRTPGVVGGLAPRLAATVLQHAQRCRSARL